MIKNQSITQLCDLFLKNELHSFKKELENSEVFIAAVSQYTEFGSSLESAVMELCHGSCHELTIILAELLEIKQIMLITDVHGFPIHSALWNGEDLILDANGVHTIETALNFWTDLVKEKCESKVVSVKRLVVFAGYDEDVMNDVLDNFEIVSKFMIENLETL
jgi:hypothetical protein